MKRKLLVVLLAIVAAVVGLMPAATASSAKTNLAAQGWKPLPAGYNAKGWVVKDGKAVPEYVAKAGYDSTLAMQKAGGFRANSADVKASPNEIPGSSVTTWNECWAGLTQIWYATTWSTPYVESDTRKHMVHVVAYDYAYLGGLPDGSNMWGFGLDWVSHTRDYYEGYLKYWHAPTGGTKRLSILSRISVNPRNVLYGNYYGYGGEKDNTEYVNLGASINGDGFGMCHKHIIDPYSDADMDDWGVAKPF